VKLDVFRYLHGRLRPLVPEGADYYAPDRDPPLSTHLANGRPWVQVYAPSEEGNSTPRQDYLVTIDIGCARLEGARALAETIRAALDGSLREPSPFRRLRVVVLDEGTFHRVQLSYRLRRVSN
jgi:hypothetical protein